MSKLNVSHTTLPEQPLTIHEWMDTFNIGSGYTKPTNYFKGNVYYEKELKQEILEKINETKREITYLNSYVSERVSDFRKKLTTDNLKKYLNVGIVMLKDKFIKEVD
jgi:hypothetical protein